MSKPRSSFWSLAKFLLIISAGAGASISPAWAETSGSFHSSQIISQTKLPTSMSLNQEDTLKAIASLFNGQRCSKYEKVNSSITVTSELDSFEFEVRGVDRIALRNRLRVSNSSDSKGHYRVVANLEVSFNPGDLTAVKVRLEEGDAGDARLLLLGRDKQSIRRAASYEDYVGGGCSHRFYFYGNL